MNRIVTRLCPIVLYLAPMFGQNLLPLESPASRKTLLAELGKGSQPLQPALAASPNPLSAVAATAAWDPYTTLDPAQNSVVIGPVFDSLGNAWVLEGADGSLNAIEWDHSSGTWQPPHSLGPVAKGGEATTGAIAVDRVGGVYFTYNAGSSNGQAPFPLMWAKYSPSAGWQAPALAYSSPDAVAGTQAAVDPIGRLIVVFSSAGVISSIVYNPATSSWGGLQNLQYNKRLDGVVPTLATNRSGTRIALAYLVVARGMQYTFFNSTTGQWDPIQAIPDSRFSTFSFGGALAFFPMAVDESGDVTLVTATYLLGFYGASGFRYENGQWTTTKLIPPSQREIDPDAFGSVAINSSGEVLVAAPGSAGSGSAKITAFRYKPGSGWTTETAVTYPLSRVTKCSVAWFQTNQAVITYAGATDSDGLQTAMYTNGVWVPGPHLPGNAQTFYPGMATGADGDVLLTLSETPAGSLATWLRP